MKLDKLFTLVGTLQVASTDHIVLKTRFRSLEEEARERKFLSAVVNTTRSALAMPPILQPSDTPREFIDTENMGEYTRISLGVVVENYSKYKLRDARTSRQENCGKNREVALIIVLIYCPIKNYLNVRRSITLAMLTRARTRYSASTTAPTSTGTCAGPFPGRSTTRTGRPC